ncbi:unnamed protein product [Vitrella brassicaformis CCMP3155]|uniref:Uncharacterized protein n=1 Tax=Vitrella brassicaformis (strain CCMP3155) TaxID=1169540 RepID=A0A0G4ENQ7_VITBC|nr:unnamed protein product [Vitrella brassicaformis CCMP3155]|eukprot:CEL98493.1 unnamed protein product [Vitrella brassicaformis CCMP3155]
MMVLSGYLVILLIIIPSCSASASLESLRLRSGGSLALQLGTANETDAANATEGLHQAHKGADLQAKTHGGQSVQQCPGMSPAVVAQPACHFAHAQCGRGAVDPSVPSVTQGSLNCVTAQAFWGLSACLTDGECGVRCVSHAHLYIQFCGRDHNGDHGHCTSVQFYEAFREGLEMQCGARIPHRQLANWRPTAPPAPRSGHVPSLGL